MTDQPNGSTKLGKQNFEKVWHENYLTLLVSSSECKITISLNLSPLEVSQPSVAIFTYLQAKHSRSSDETYSKTAVFALLPFSTNSGKPRSAQGFLYRSKNVCPLFPSFSSIRLFLVRIITVLPSREPRHFRDAAHLLSGQWRGLRHIGSQNPHRGVCILPSTRRPSRMQNICKAISIPSLILRVNDLYLLRLCLIQ